MYIWLGDETSTWKTDGSGELRRMLCNCKAASWVEPGQDRLHYGALV